MKYHTSIAPIECYALRLEESLSTDEFKTQIQEHGIELQIEISEAEVLFCVRRKGEQLYTGTGRYGDYLVIPPGRSPYFSTYEAFISTWKT